MKDTSAMEAGARTEALKKRAADLGFDACAVAAADAIDPKDDLGIWLAKGYHADMTWMETTLAVRQDVQQKLPGTRSVVVVARNYYSQRPAPDPAAICGVVSRYAWGRDYHRVLRKPLQGLADYINGLEPGGRCYCSIDSGPVLEKFWAAKAGLGWVAKNSLILRRDLGSWFFLGVILTTVELTPDQPVADHCGTCRACLDACPTGAIVEPGVVDSRLCISYHTIENRGEIPEPLQPRFGRWVFGCDLCQEICPWNQKATETNERAFWPRAGQADPDLEDLLGLTEDTFRERFAGTPLLRAKHAGMLRNARVALRNASQQSHGNS